MTPLPDSDLRELEGHTPGPWVVVGQTVYRLGWQNADGLYVAEECAEPAIAALSTPRSVEEREANARLIAAAPSLIADLRETRERIGELESALEKIADPEHNTYCLSNPIGPLFGAGWNAAADHIADRACDALARARIKELEGKT